MEIKGLDLSHHNAGINFDSVVNNGYEFVILRGSFTWKYNGETPQKDDSFEDFYAKAKAKGLKVGAYHYSCANTAEEGEAEAKFLYDNCLLGKSFEYPIYIDVEDEQYQGADKQGTTDAIIAFCEYLENLGYYVGIYASESWFTGRIDTSRLTSYDKWLAFWTANKPRSVVDYGVWQNSSSEMVDGIRVDTDYAYKDYPSIMTDNKLNGCNGSTVAPTPQPIATTLKEGDVVVLNTTASVYKGASDGVKIPKSIKGKQYTISQVNTDIVLLSEINSWVLASDCTLTTATDELFVGDKVTVLNPINYDTGTTFKLYYPEYDVIQVNDDRVVIGIGNTVTSAISRNYVKKV